MIHLPDGVHVAVFEVLRNAPHVGDGLLIRDRVIVRREGGELVYELFRRLRAVDIEDVMTPDMIDLKTTEPDAGFAETARAFARAPSVQRVPLRRVK